jgi:hypothetical protein
LHWLILLQSHRLWRVSCHLGKYMFFFFFWTGNQNQENQSTRIATHFF